MYKLFIFILLFLFTQSGWSQQQLLVLQPDSICGKDAMVHGLSGYTNLNLGNNVQLPVTSWTFSSIPGTVRSLIEFDLSSLPPNATIVQANLSLYAWPYTNGMGQHSSQSGSNSAWVKRVISSWDEQTVTWNTQPNTTNLNQVALPQSTSPTQNYINVDVTTLVDDMLQNIGSSYGFMFQLQTEQYYRRLNFCSSDYSVANLRPKLEIEYIGSPVVSYNLNLGNDTVLCNGGQLLLSPGILSGEYIWQDGSTSSVYNVEESGEYSVQVSTCNHVYRDTISIEFSEEPSVNFGSDTVLCIGNTLSLNVDQMNSISTYLWQDGTVASNYTITEPGEYWVQISNNCNIVSDTIYVKFKEGESINLGEDISLCENNEVILNAEVEDALGYLWQDNSSGEELIVTQSGIYWVEVETLCGVIADTIEIDVLLNPVVDLGEDIKLCEGDQITLDVHQDNSIYLWQDNSITPQLEVLESGVYWVEVTNACGSVRDTLIVSKEDCLDCSIKYPNSFTPNGDLINDVFIPIVDCDLVNFSLDIYDRWGKRLYNTTDWNIGWNGMYKEEVVSNGVYVYKSKYAFDSGQVKHLEGSVLVIR